MLFGLTLPQERQQRFLEHLALHGSVAAAARSAVMSRQSAYWLRRQKVGAAFATQWDAALADSGRWLEDMALDRLLDGEEEVIEREGDWRVIYTEAGVVLNVPRVAPRGAAYRGDG